jgi:LuxR family maltose regulon positive regulatory protein
MSLLVLQDSAPDALRPGESAEHPLEERGAAAARSARASERAASGGPDPSDAPTRDSKTDDLLMFEIVSLLVDEAPGARAEQQPLADALSQAEARVLRHLPTHLTAVEIAAELCISVNTVKTHMRHIYAKLNVHRRREVVERARELGLLAPGLGRPSRKALAR